MKATEAILQAAVMRWAMVEKHHMYVIPNSNGWYPWEADLLTVTRSELVHEFEVKVSMADYKRDAQKHKHRSMTMLNSGPSYFWYVTCFEIEPPENAGWIEVYEDVHRGWQCRIRKEAPRRNLNKIGRSNHLMIARTLSWRVMNHACKRLDKLPDDYEEKIRKMEKLKRYLDTNRKLYADRRQDRQYNLSFARYETPDVRAYYQDLTSRLNEADHQIEKLAGRVAELETQLELQEE